MQGLSPLHNGFTKAFAFVIAPAALRAAFCLRASPARGPEGRAIPPGVARCLQAQPGQKIGTTAPL